MQTESTPHLPTNHVFVDLENVKVIDQSVIGGKNLILHLFLGPHNKKLIVAKAPAPKPLSAGAEKLLKNLSKAVKNRPLRKQTLVNHAKQSLGKEATVEMGERVVGELQKAGYLGIDDKGAVSYQL
jgi:hypothetical protein